jgi:hypothetical protein
MSEWLKEHTLEIALTVRDGVPQISITVADPESQVRARHVNRSPVCIVTGLSSGRWPERFVLHMQSSAPRPRRDPRRRRGQKAQDGCTIVSCRAAHEF